MAVGTGVARVALVALRLASPLRYYTRGIAAALRWAVQSREVSNYTYSYTPWNREFLAHLLGVVSGQPVGVVRGYLAEGACDQSLFQELANRRLAAGVANVVDPEMRLGRQLAWYALTRLVRPARVVESGVGYGLSAALVSQALLKNAREGAPGEYVGVDRHPEAGVLLGVAHRSVARIVRADALAGLREIDGPIDLFISDTHVSADLEYAECRMVLPKLSEQAIVATTVSRLLPRFAEETGRRCLVFREEPDRHWYPGAWIGFAFPEGIA